MSAIYNLEPQPTGSAIIHTTLGEISVELFAKQTPLACRNFLQLALDGYYDDTIFHRLVPNFILQGGDPTGTGNGGESIFDGGAFSGDLDPWPMDERRGRNAGPNGVGFKDEFHSRLKFNRRGLLGMANESHKDTNGSQFFFTLDRAEELNGKNTMFGRVAGDTIYNLAKIGELEVDAAAERPLYPVKVQKIEVLVNPFEDMKKRERRAAVQTQTKSTSQDKDKKKKRKGGKQLLSFGDEEGEEEVPVPKKMKFDTRIVMDDGAEDEPKPKSTKSKSKGKERMSPTRSLPTREAPAPQSNKDDDDSSTAVKPGKSKKAKISYDEESPEPEPAKPEKTALERANEEMAALKASMRRTVHTEQEKEAPKKSALESMVPETSMRARKRRPGQTNTTAAEEQEAMKMLKDFQSRLERMPAGKEREDHVKASDQDGAEGNASGGAAPDEEAELCDLHFIANCQSCTSWDKQEKDDASDDDGDGWMSHALTFAADRLGKDLTNRRKAEEELVVIDPRDRAKTLKEEKRAGRDRGGKSGSGREWDMARDQARNAKLAKEASLAGRGAK
ncbi:cyclophilin type peptidyl-prolyl cis-trans isomerase/CLD domain-containing protein [Sarocladium implicatum]|nr:cyclophilin type peptidyl-prolyl cis-trans isomerase/CLD domain-containing protein [Sarocladium implicatum]